MIRRPLLCCLWFCLALTLPLQAEIRTWTNVDGVKIQAGLVRAQGDQVTLRLANGREVTFAQDKLSAEDREFLRTAAEPKPPLGGASKSSADSEKRNARWLTRMSRAKQEAKETGLPILVLFTGTSWCPYCIKLEKEVFEQKEFKEFADKNLVLLILDFEPGGSAKNKESEELAQSFGVRGFPTYFLTDADGKRLASGGYHKGITPESFAQWVKGAK